MMKMKSYRDYFHFDDGDVSATAASEGGECDNCGSSGQQFYCHRGAVGPKKLCGRCARVWCGVTLEPIHVNGSGLMDGEM
jgi:hypothetical protein